MTVTIKTQGSNSSSKYHKVRKCKKKNNNNNKIIKRKCRNCRKTQREEMVMQSQGPTTSHGSWNFNNGCNYPKKKKKKKLLPDAVRTVHCFQTPKVQMQFARCTSFFFSFFFFCICRFWSQKNHLGKRFFVNQIKSYHSVRVSQPRL